MIYFGGLYGVNAFNPNDFQSEKEKANNPLQITDFVQWDKDGNEIAGGKQHLIENSEIIVKPNGRFFRLGFKLLTYDNENEILYAYRLEGKEESWNYQKENSIRFNGLPYGEHNLVIKAQSADGTWEENEIRITLKVIRPFYLTAWFIILGILVVALGAISLFRYRVTQIKSQARFLEEEVRKRTQKIREDKLLIEQQAESLKSLDKIKSNFFANVSHELRTPLTLISGPVQTMLNNRDLDEKDKKLLGFVERNTKLLNKLVNEILDLSKLESNEVKLNEDVIEFYPFLQNIVETFNGSDKSSDIHFNVSKAVNKNLVINLDKTRFEKVINNLLSNASKYSGEGGKIHVHVKEGKELLYISVEDEGIGIHEEDLPQIFNRYYQSNNPDAKTEGGTGIGLALCKELLDLMGGSIAVESKLNEGSRFEILIPKKTISKDSFEKAIENDPGEEENVFEENYENSLIREVGINSNLTNYSILIAEDNVELQEYYRMILEDYNLKITDNGRQAMEHLINEEKMPDLIISDVMMPEMDGVEFLTRIKSSDKWRHIPFVMITAKYDQEVKINALRYGIDDYINKPFDHEEMQVRIANLLKNQDTKKEFTLENKADSEEDNTNIKISESDLNWLKEFEDYILSNLGDENLSISSITKEFVMSESTLLRKLKKLTGLTPKKYIQEIRLNRAKELIEKKSFKTISEIGYHVGYRDSTSFSRSFKSRFGISPSKLHEKQL